MQGNYEQQLTLWLSLLLAAASACRQEKEPPSSQAIVSAAAKATASAARGQPSNSSAVRALPRARLELARWAKSFGSTVNDSSAADARVRNEAGVSVAFDADGSILVLGQFHGTLVLGDSVLKSAGGVDMFVAKFDGRGACVWAKRFGGVSDDEPERIAVDAAGSIYIVSKFQGSVDFGGGTFTDDWGGVVLKLDQSGNHVWSRHVAGGISLGLALTGDGGVVASGNFWEKLTITDQSQTPKSVSNKPRALAAFVVKFKGDGATSWLKTYPHTSGRAVAASADGSVVFLGQVSRTVDFGGGPLQGAGAYDVAVVKLDANGGHLWSKRFGAKSDDRGEALSVAGQGEVVLVGSFSQPIDFGGGKLISHGGEDIFVAKLDAQGNHLWSKRFGGVKDDHARDVALSGAEVAVTGSFREEAEFDGKTLVSQGGSDAYVLRLEAGGKVKWCTRLGAAESDRGFGVALDSSGGLAATGNFLGTTSYEGTELRAAGAHDIYLITHP